MRRDKADMCRANRDTEPDTGKKAKLSEDAIVRRRISGKYGVADEMVKCSGGRVGESEIKRLRD